MSGPRRGGGRLPRASEGGSWGDEVYGVPVLGYEFATWGSLESPSPCHGENREFKSRRRDHFDLGGGLLGRHRPETKKRLDAEHRARHRFKINAAERLTRLKLRREVLQRYGEVCAICGFSDARALHLDHVENNGALERRIAGGGRFRSFSMLHRLPTAGGDRAETADVDAAGVPHAGAGGVAAGRWLVAESVQRLAVNQEIAGSSPA
jgi:hypothetical protein